MTPSRTSSVSSTPSSRGGTRTARPPALSTACTYCAGTSAVSISQSPKFAAVKYVVIPTIGRSALPTFEQPLPLVAGDDLVEEPLLDASVVDVMVDNRVAERRARNRPFLERGHGLAERRGEPL